MFPYESSMKEPVNPTRANLHSLTEDAESAAVSNLLDTASCCPNIDFDTLEAC